MNKRVAITGLGMLTPIGHNVQDTFEALIQGKSGVSNITHFDASLYRTRIAAEVKGFDPFEHFPKKEVKKMDPFTHFAVVAAREAHADSGIKLEGELAEKTGVIIGTGMGGLGTIEHYHSILQKYGPDKMSPFCIPASIPNMNSGRVSMDLGAKGCNMSPVSACATGNHSIGEAFRSVQRGEAIAVIAGGSEAAITPVGISGFAAMRAMTTRNDDPEHASRPFDLNRDGFIMGEGAGIMIIEELEHALARGAKIYGEVAGYGATSDAYHISTPDPEAEGPTRSMKLAIEDAGLEAHDIDYINAHGTSTKYNDANETKAIKRVFGDHAYKLMISSTKSMTGHLLGAAGGIEAVISVLAIHKGIIPPTTNYETPDPECDLDYVPNKAREAEVKAALTNSFGFGGTNATLVFKRYE